MNKENSHFLLFNINGYRFAIDLFNVDRIIRSVEVTALPNAPDIILGIINVGGNIMPVIDIRKRFNFPEKAININDFVIIGHTKELPVAMVVDNVDELVEIPQKKVVSKEKILPGISHIEGVLKLEGDIIYIHDLDKFLYLEEEKELKNVLKDLKKEEKKSKNKKIKGKKSVSNKGVNEKMEKKKSKK